MDNKQEVRIYMQKHDAHITNISRKLIDIIETVYRGASKGRGLVVSPKGMYSSMPFYLMWLIIGPDYSTRYRY